MSETATPATPETAATPAAAPAATPVADAGTVILPKEEADQLRRDAARAAASQRKADLYDRTVGSGKTHFKQNESTPQVAPTAEERAAAASEEDRKAERGLLAIAADPEYREVLDADPTLRTLLMTNPLGILPALAPEAIDADDAIALVKEQLSKRKPAKVEAKVETPAEKPAANTVPPAGGVNPNTPGVDEAYEAARKLPNTESAIAGMIGSKARAMKK